MGVLEHPSITDLSKAKDPLHDVKRMLTFDRTVDWPRLRALCAPLKGPWRAPLSLMNSWAWGATSWIVFLCSR